MKLLILGGTAFLGRHLVDEALARGHEVTVFNRGITPASLPAGVLRLCGDRTSDLSALEGRRWDAAIDTSGYIPSAVRASARLLAGAVEHYAFVSSLSVYAGFARAGMDEESPLASLTEAELAEIEVARPTRDGIVASYAERYGALKVLCERAVEACFPRRTLHVRAGLMVGPHDYMDRLPWWVRRVARGGEVLAPGPPSRSVQLVDARDLAGWIVRMSEARRPGTFNATGPARELTLGELLQACRDATGSDARVVWVSDAFLLERGVTPWTELPLWIPGPDAAGFFRVDCRRAFAAGLSFRPLAETLRDVVAWESASQKSGLGRAALTGADATARGGSAMSDAAAVVPGPGLEEGREHELLGLWAARSAQPG